MFAYLFGAVIVVVAETTALDSGWPNPQIALYVVLAFGSGGCGVALIQTGLVAGWVGSVDHHLEHGVVGRSCLSSARVTSTIPCSTMSRRSSSGSRRRCKHSGAGFRIFQELMLTLNTNQVLKG